MKLKFIFFVVFGCIGASFGQSYQLKIVGKLLQETKIIDSLGYFQKHSTIKSVEDQLAQTTENLSNLGYIDNQIVGNERLNDSNFVAQIHLNKKIKSVHIYIGNLEDTEKQLLGLQADSLKMPYVEVVSFLKNNLNRLEQNGYALAKLKLDNIRKKNNILFADLQFDAGVQRKLSAIVVKLSDKNKGFHFPKGHLMQLNRKYKRQNFNQELVKKIKSDFDKFRFISQVKYPEILMTPDATQVFVYLEKRKANTFDGFLGFANSETKKIGFNGYLDFLLENTLGAGEQLALNWKSDDNDQKTFKASIDMPYIFNSPLGIKAQLHIFRQDSIFQNSKTNIALGYFINYNARVYIGRQTTTSSDIQGTNSATISDFENSFWTMSFEYKKADTQNLMFPEKAAATLLLGFGSRTTTGLIETLGKQKQNMVSFNASNNFHLNAKNVLNINYQNYFLKSNAYITNELHRFGGTNSIRGVAENSLQASFMTAIATEYRYLVSPDFYVHSILDYGYYEDKTSGFKGKVLGAGLGLGLKTNNGLLKITFADSQTNNKSIALKNLLVAINYGIKF